MFWMTVPCARYHISHHRDARYHISHLGCRGVWYRSLRWCEMWYRIIRVIVSENWRKSSHWIQIFSISDEFQNFEKYFQNSFRYFLKFQIFPKTRFPVYSVSVWWLRMLYWKGGRIPRFWVDSKLNEWIQKNWVDSRWIHSLSLIQYFEISIQ